MNPKTRRIIRIICLAACAISLVMLFLLLSWFYIRGAEFRFLKELPADCEVTYTKEVWNDSTKEYDTVDFSLTKEQLTDVLALMEKGAYWRILSRTITHDEDAIYYIFCEFSKDSNQHYLVISFVGGYAVAIDSSVPEFAQNGFLRILNKSFLSELESIIIP